MFSPMSNLQTYYHFKLYFQKVDQHTRGKWLIHGTKRSKAISCKAWNSPVEYPSRECKHDIKESKGNLFNPIFEVRRYNSTWFAHITQQLADEVANMQFNKK